MKKDQEAIQTKVPGDTQQSKVDESKIAQLTVQTVKADISNYIAEAIKSLPSSNWNEMDSIDSAFQEALKNQPNTTNDW